MNEILREKLDTLDETIGTLVGAIADLKSKREILDILIKHSVGDTAQKYGITRDFFSCLLEGVEDDLRFKYGGMVDERIVELESSLVRMRSLREELLSIMCS